MTHSHKRHCARVRLCVKSIITPTQPKPTMNPKQPCAYIMASAKNGTLYTGVTSNLAQRVYQHKSGTTNSFAHKYNCCILVWYELHENMITAIEREKHIKSGNRQRKIALIEALNPQWTELYDSIIRA
jgi:predicted GIY-YIG superfamily endonuclease